MLSKKLSTFWLRHGRGLTTKLPHYPTRFPRYSSCPQSVQLTTISSALLLVHDPCPRLTLGQRVSPETSESDSKLSLGVVTVRVRATIVRRIKSIVQTFYAFLKAKLFHKILPQLILCNYVDICKPYTQQLGQLGSKLHTHIHTQSDYCNHSCAVPQVSHLNQTQEVGCDHEFATCTALESLYWKLEIGQCIILFFIEKVSLVTTV